MATKMVRVGNLLDIVRSTEIEYTRRAFYNNLPVIVSTGRAICEYVYLTQNVSI